MKDENFLDRVCVCPCDSAGIHCTSLFAGCSILVCYVSREMKLKENYNNFRQVIIIWKTIIVCRLSYTMNCIRQVCHGRLTADMLILLSRAHRRQLEKSDKCSEMKTKYPIKNGRDTQQNWRIFISNLKLTISGLCNRTKCEMWWSGLGEFLSCVVKHIWELAREHFHIHNLSCVVFISLFVSFVASIKIICLALGDEAEGSSSLIFDENGNKEL